MSGNLKELGPDTWLLRVYVGKDATGRKREKTKVFRGNEAAARKALRKHAADVGTVDVSVNATVNDLADAWWKVTAPKLSPSTRRGYRTKLEHWIKPRWGTTRIAKIGVADLEAWYADLVADHGLAPNTVRNIYVVLSSMYAAALRWGWVTSSPTTLARKPSIPRPKRHAPDPSVLVELITNAQSLEFGTFLRLAAATGARRGELCGLRWSDLDGDVLTIERSIVHDDITREPVVKSTKTDTERSLTLDAGTVAALKSHHALMAERALGLGARYGAKAYVFSDFGDGSEPWRPDTVTVMFVRLRELVGIEGVRLHDLRHAHVTLLLASGVARADVRDRVGHLSDRTTAGYEHSIPSSYAAQVIGGLLDAATK